MRKETNPALAVGFEKAVSDGTTMTVRGTIVKILIMTAILGVAFVYSWIAFQNPDVNYRSALVVSMIGALILGLLTSFIPKIAQYTAVFYAAFEGVLLGSISRYFESMFPGIVFPAILLTIICLVATVLIYRRTPEVAGRIRKGVFIAIISIAAIYLLGMILSFFGIMLPIYGSGIIGIGFSLFVVVVATASLIMDYDFILKAEQYGYPKYMEWYGAFGLMVTLIWLYTEILSLLAKIMDNN
ncbi:Bax inhibitor-1/YccA family protein [Clostridium sp. LIBA-8841]|uniref:Bax inhibitor-1/YccA family protein n=1 Tax=Clostridium sp. LIBA-8841 TaxID=2987530 RepID=UPI002AC594C1|nr:Bax inhibitor-1/YccA family protein [Clostridium sp. LIBA-8841]MDZ5252110.1 Bax inhibitor-1/YccA family protein [Clostridium sp. LIBA-8841]